MKIRFKAPFDVGASNWLWLTLLVILADQWTKRLVTSRLDEFEAVVLLPVLDFMRLHNEGAAFSFLSNASGWQRWFFITLAIGVSAGILGWLRVPVHDYRGTVGPGQAQVVTIILLRHFIIGLNGTHEIES